MATCVPSRPIGVTGMLLLAVVALGACEAADRLEGAATVIDGDSLEIGGTSIRLFGIDAPEGKQTCARAGRQWWPCGAVAAERLREMVGTRSVSCISRDVDEYGRTVATCRSGDVDLAAEMARLGFALAYTQFSRDYVDEQDAARAAARGLWSGAFVPPWEWRRGERATRADAAPAPEPVESGADCRIKGNIARSGERIYHVPGSRSYAETVIDTERGERWFCSEQEALRAGWRAPRG